MLNNYHSKFPDVEPKSAEVKKNTEAKISCTIADISTAMQITWSELTSGDTTHISVSDTFYPETENQISIITMTSEVVISDKVFTCTVSSLQNPTSDQTNFKVELKVYGELYLKIFLILDFSKQKSGLFINLTD